MSIVTVGDDELLKILSFLGYSGCFASLPCCCKRFQTTVSKSPFRTNLWKLILSDLASPVFDIVPKDSYKEVEARTLAVRFQHLNEFWRFVTVAAELWRSRNCGKILPEDCEVLSNQFSRVQLLHIFPLIAFQNRQKIADQIRLWIVADNRVRREFREFSEGTLYSDLPSCMISFGMDRFRECLETKEAFLKWSKRYDHFHMRAFHHVFQDLDRWFCKLENKTEGVFDTYNDLN
jgi:hypothetical protein